MDLGGVFLGLLQGIAEWLPISSKTVVLLASAYIYGYTLATSYNLGLSLQGGTVVAAATYFWRDLMRVFRDMWILRFLVISTIFTGVVGVPIYILSRKLLEESLNPGLLMIIVGFLLILQVLISRRTKNRDYGKTMERIGLRDSIVFGCVQGLAAMPGISRSGVTIAALLYLGYRLESAMKLSFIASIPANLGATAVVYLLDREALYREPTQDIAVAFIVSATVGMATIGLLLRLAARYRVKLTAGMGILALIIGSISLAMTPSL
jgi:undecaprenyl-diphosphatase